MTVVGVEAAVSGVSLIVRYGRQSDVSGAKTASGRSTPFFNAELPIVPEVHWTLRLSRGRSMRLASLRLLDGVRFILVTNLDVWRRSCVGGGMDHEADLIEVITAVLRQAPQWVRADLVSRDGALRERAEDALAAIVANAIAEARNVTVEQPSRH